MNNHSDSSTDRQEHLKLEVNSLAKE